MTMGCVVGPDVASCWGVGPLLSVGIAAILGLSVVALAILFIKRPGRLTIRPPGRAEQTEWNPRSWILNLLVTVTVVVLLYAFSAYAEASLWPKHPEWRLLSILFAAAVAVVLGAALLWKRIRNG